MVRKIALVSALIYFGCIVTVSAQSESINITTYYPSPYGIYNQLRVDKGGLILGGVVDKAEADKWTDIEEGRIPSGGMYIVSVVPTDEKTANSTFSILFSASSKGVALSVNAGAFLFSTGNFVSAEFRVKASLPDSFVLQIKPTKDSQVHIGKILSYLSENNKKN